ncbi:unnamed protein product [Urochloa humidicola]
MVNSSPVKQILPETSSRLLMESVTATHDFNVTNFSLLDGVGIGNYISSRTFSSHSGDWNIRLYPDGRRQEVERSSLCVDLPVFPWRRIRS